MVIVIVNAYHSIVHVLWDILYVIISTTVMK